jgi:hypothetical protein
MRMKLLLTLVLLAMTVTGCGRAATSPTPCDVGQPAGEGSTPTETAAPPPSEEPEPPATAVPQLPRAGTMCRFLKRIPVRLRPCWGKRGRSVPGPDQESPLLSPTLGMTAPPPGPYDGRAVESWAWIGIPWRE